MHRDYKQRRAADVNRQLRRLWPEKEVDQKALEKFREKPCQLKYAEMLRKGGVKGADGRHTKRNMPEISDGKEAKRTDQDSGERSILKNNMKPR